MAVEMWITAEAMPLGSSKADGPEGPSLIGSKTGGSARQRRAKGWVRYFSLAKNLPVPASPPLTLCPPRSPRGRSSCITGTHFPIGSLTEEPYAVADHDGGDTDTWAIFRLGLTCITSVKTSFLLSIAPYFSLAL